VSKYYTSEPAHDDPKDMCVLCCKLPQFRMHLCRECHAEREGSSGLVDFHWGIVMARKVIIEALIERARRFDAQFDPGLWIAQELRHCIAELKEGRLP
jgi:hypothetical protein